mmetsp:Transcript_15708/g.23795  ORF Transcript_15708/g.23795 Transcript_15708/m.23795 type:complete len:1062 (-) Transcript_15708:205-3390(-)
MVFTRRSQGGENEQLLSNKKGERSEDVPRVLKKKKLTKRISAIFKKSSDQKSPAILNEVIEDTETAPPTPETTDEKLDLEIFSHQYTEPKADSERIPDDRSYGGTTISDLSVSINPITSPPNLALYGTLPVQHYSGDDIVDGQGSEGSKATKPDDFENSCVVQSLLGLVDETCGTTHEPEDETNNKPRNQYGTMYSTDLTHDTEDHTADYGSTIGTNDERDVSTKTSVTTYTMVSHEGPSHEDFELILDPKSIGHVPELKPVSTPAKGNGSPTASRDKSPDEQERNEALSPMNGSKTSTGLKSLSSPHRLPRVNPAQRLSPFVYRLKGRNKSPSKTTSTQDRGRRLKLNLNTKKSEKNKTKAVVSSASEEDGRGQASNNVQNVADTQPKLSVMLSEDELVGEECVDENGVTTIVASHYSPVKNVEQPRIDPIKTSKERTCTNASDEDKPSISSNYSWNVSLNRVLPFGKISTKTDEELHSVNTSPPRLAGNSNPAPAWKEVADPTTGRLYYYHRLTRKTTWTKPPKFVKCTKQQDEEQKQEKEQKEPESSTIETKKEVSPQFKAQSQDIDLSADNCDKSDDDETMTDNMIIVGMTELSAEKQKEIDEGRYEILSKASKSSILKNSNVNKSSDSLDKRPKTRYELVEIKKPREEDIVDFSVSEIDDHQIGSINRVKSLPFDEESFVKQRSPRNLSLTEASLSKRTQSLNSAFTGKTENTTKSENTERMKNTVEDDFVSDNHVTKSNEGLDGEILSIHNEPGQILRSNKQKHSAAVQGRQESFQRTRDLRVEEFTSSRFGLTTENYNEQASPSRKTARQRRLLGLKNRSPAQESRKGPVAAITSKLKMDTLTSFESEDYYNGDNDESDYETQTDTVSALSNPDVDIQNLQRNFDKARRQALDDAIRRKDWDLAASVTDHIRNRSYERGESNYYFQEEWTQSEIDKFISESDWDAVASYIAYMRDNNESLVVDADEIDAPLDEATPTEKRRITPDVDDATLTSKDASVQKRFGARSQLQHEENAPSISSWDSESFWESDEYSSASSGDDGRVKPYVRQREKFAC